MIWVCESLRISQRQACRVLGQARSTQRQARGVSGEEERLMDRIIALATRYGRYGYRRITAQDVIYQMGKLFLERGIPEHIRSDNAPEFTARAIRQWLRDLGVKTLYIELWSPWENGYIESFNGKLREELLNVEIFTTLFEAQVLIKNWRKDYNQVRPHSALGYRPPAPEAILPGYGSKSLTLSVMQ